jgi:hypothetical protein
MMLEYFVRNGIEDGEALRAAVAKFISVEA